MFCLCFYTQLYIVSNLYIILLVSKGLVMDFTFPYSTCEKPQMNSIIQQPYSTIVNVLTVALLMYFLYISKSWYLKIVFLTYIIFEIWHTISHMIFIGGHIHQNISHILAYVIAFVTLIVFLHLTKSRLSNNYVILLFIFVCIDIYIALFVGGIYMILSGIIIFIIILSIFYKRFKSNILYFIFLLLGLILLELNESFNCRSLLVLYPYFPFHIFIEIYGLILFYILSKMLLTLDR